jgi:hypothetical protein
LRQMSLNKKRVLLGAAFTAFLFIWGCETQYPPTGAMYSGPDRTLVADFDGANPTTVSSNLFELGVPGSHVQLPGPVTAFTDYGIPAGLINITQSLSYPGANGTSAGFGAVAQVNEVSSSSVTSATVYISAKPENANNGFYNGSIFKGIEFYMKVMPGDGANTRTLTAKIAQITGPEEGGLCASAVGCWAHFTYTLTTSTDGRWYLFDVPFTSFTRESWGKAMTPSDLSGDNLTKIMAMQWSETGPNWGSYMFDFSVDQIRFYY